ARIIRCPSSEDKAEQDPGLTAGVTGLCEAFLLLEVPHRRGRVVAVDPVDPTGVRADREQQALQVPDRVAGSTLGQVQGERETAVGLVELAPRDGPGYSVHRPGADVGLEGSQRGIRQW